MFRITIVFLWIFLLMGSGFSAQPQIGLKDLMLSAERNFKQVHEARNAALALNQPTTIYLPQGIMIDVMGIENGKPVYAVMTNLAHPFEGGYTAFYEQIAEEFNLSNARIHYGKKKVIHPDVGFPAERAVTQNKLLLIPESTGDRVMAFDAMTGDLVDSDFIPMSTNIPLPIQANLTPWSTISISDQNADVVQEFDAFGTYIGTLAPAGGPNPNIVENMRGHEYRPNRHLLVTVASGANDDAVAEFDSSGTYLGNFIANAAGGLNSPEGIFYRSSDILVSGGSSTPSGVFRYDFNGNFLSMLASISSFAEQVVEFSDSNVGVADFSGSQTGIVVLDSSGNLLRTLTGVSGNRGVWLLGNGDILTTNGAGVHELNYTTGALIRTVVPGVGARFISQPACTPGFLGDINGYDFVNSTDALLILSFDAGLPLPQPFLNRIAIGFADVNEDGLSNSTDAAIIIFTDVSPLPIPFPVGDPVCLP